MMAISLTFWTNEDLISKWGKNNNHYFMALFFHFTDLSDHVKTLRISNLKRIVQYISSMMQMTYTKFLGANGVYETVGNENNVLMSII